MNASKTTFLYHAVLLLLLVILLTTTLLDRYTPVRTGQASALTPTQTAEPVEIAMANTQVTAPLASTSGADNQVSIEVRAEVVANGNGNASANVSGPGNAIAKAATEGPGNAQAKAIGVVPDDKLGLLFPQDNATNASPVSTLGGNQPDPAIAPDTPYVVVSGSQVNLRSAPGLDSTILGVVNGGAKLSLIGRTADQQWWRVCCYDGNSFWIAASLVNAYGATNVLPTIESPQSQPSSPKPAATVAATATPTSVPAVEAPTAVAYDFNVAEKIQFEERVMPRIYIYVASDTGSVAGYSLRVHKDGTQIPTPLSTFGGTAEVTWGQQTSRQRFYNLKLEFPSISSEGLWDLQLLDPSGREAGAPVQFRLVQNDPNQEMYVKYIKVR